jgi:hypothetical protein
MPTPVPINALPEDLRINRVPDELLPDELTGKTEPAPIEPAKSKSTGLGAATQMGIRSILPGLAGFSGAEAGAAAGAGLLAPLGPIPAVGGALLGGLGGMYLGSTAAQQAQDAALAKVPQFAKSIYQSPEQIAEAEREHPYYSMAGSIIGNMAALRPDYKSLTSLSKLVESTAPETATTAERILSTPVANSAIGASLGAGQELYNQSFADEYDPYKVGLATLGGALSTKKTQLGERIANVASPLGEFAVSPITSRFKPKGIETAGTEEIQETEEKQPLRLTGPKEVIKDAEAKDPFLNPVGNFSKEELGDELHSSLNADRIKDKKPELTHFSLEDLHDAGVDQGKIQSLLANKTQYNPTLELTPENIINLAQSKNIDPTTEGFRDFMRRSTGTDNVEEMAPPQLHSAFQALKGIHSFEENTILPSGTNASRFTNDQYRAGVDAVHDFLNDSGEPFLKATSVIPQVKEATGLTNDADVFSLLRTARRNGEITARVTEGKPNETMAPGAGTAKTDPHFADQIEVGLPKITHQLLPGIDIRPEEISAGSEPSEFKLSAGKTQFDSEPSRQDAEIAKDRLTAQREQQVADVQKQINKNSEKMQKNQEDLDALHALNGADDRYVLAKSETQKLNRDLLEKNNELTEQFNRLQEPIEITQGESRQITKQQYTLHENDQPIASFPDQHSAERHAISRMSDEQLNDLIARAPAFKELMPQRLASFAKQELADRARTGGIEIQTQNKDRASENLANVGVYTPEVKERIAALEKKLLPALKKLGLEKVGLRLIGSIENGTADGYYLKNLITIAMDSTDHLGTLRHESIHALRELGAFSDNEWKILTNKADKEWINKYIGDDLKKRYAEMYEKQYGTMDGFNDYIREEAIAEAFKHFKDKAPAGLIHNIAYRLNKFFETLRNGFSELGFKNSTDIFRNIEAGQQRIRTDAAQAGQPRYSLRRIENPNLREFLGNGAGVDRNGKPIVYYHGTSKDITDFRAKQAGAIFLTKSPAFAEGFGDKAQAYTREQMFADMEDGEKYQFMHDALKEAYEEARAKFPKHDFSNSTYEYLFKNPESLAKITEDAFTEKTFGNNRQEFYQPETVKDLNSGVNISHHVTEKMKQMLDKKMPTTAHTMPLYVRALKPFDFDKASHLKALKKQMIENGMQEGTVAQLMERVKVGQWQSIESPAVQKAIRALGHDGFYVTEVPHVKDNDPYHDLVMAGKNLAVYDSGQIKSAIANKGTYDYTNPDIRYSLRQNIPSDITEAIDRTTTSRNADKFHEGFIQSLIPKGMDYYLTKARQGLIYEGHSVEKLSKLKGKIEGPQALLASVSAHGAYIQALSASNLSAQAFIEGRPIFRNGHFTIDPSKKGLLEVLAPLSSAAKGDPYVYQAFQFYGGAKRAERLIREGREKTFKQADVEKAKALEKQFPEFKQVWEDWQDYNKDLVKLMVDRGVLTPEMGHEWSRYSDYIPFYRQLDGETTVGPNIFGGISGIKIAKKLEGNQYYAVLDKNGKEVGRSFIEKSAQVQADKIGGKIELKGVPVADFLETVARNTRAAIEASMKNEAGNRVIRDATELGLALPLEGTVSGEDIVNIRVNGQNKYFQVADPLLVESMKALNLPQMPGLAILAAPARFLRNMVTKDPGFILSNLMRDSTASWLTSGTNITPVIDSFKSYAKILANQSPEAQALRRAGVSGVEFQGKMETTGKEMAKRLREMTGTRTTLEKGLLPASAFWKGLEHASESSELASRAEVFKRTLERVGDEAEAVHQAREIMNFSRRGSWAVARIAGAMIPFMNARLQGLDVLYRVGFGKMATQNAEMMQKAFIARSVQLLGLASLYWYMVHDTDEYKKLSQSERDNYWIIPGMEVNGKPFRFPIPFELGILFKVLPERIAEYTYGNDTGRDFTSSMARQLVSTLQINPIPQAVLPIMENTTNYSMFTGQPIVSRGLNDIAPQFQYNQNTTELAKELGKEFGYSPMKIDHLISGYTGTMGLYTAQMLDTAIEMQTGSAPKAALRFEQLPIIKRFVATDSGTIENFYELKDEVNEVVRTVSHLSASPVERAEYLKENIGLFSLKDYIASVESQMKQLRKTSLMINQNKNMTPDEKKDALERIHNAEVSLTQSIQKLRKKRNV